MLEPGTLTEVHQGHRGHIPFSWKRLVKVTLVGQMPVDKAKNLFQPVAIHWVSDMLAAFQGVWSCPEEPGWSSALKKFDAGPNSLLGTEQEPVD